MPDAELQENLRYLGGPEAERSIRSNVYWPKWDSPWWRATLMNEMGLARQVPPSAIAAIVRALKHDCLQIFPVQPHELPEGMDGSRDTHCHCGVGNMYQLLSAHGVDVDAELPWMRAWFLRYQLSDGGLNCDNDAYLLPDPPSSMVGTIPPLEAVLLHTRRPWTEEEIRFLDRGADFLIGRKLMLASSKPGNEDEKQDEEDWLKPCFPRFYLYDVLRGLSWLLMYAKLRERAIPREAVDPVLRSLESRFGEGPVRIERTAYSGIGSLIEEAPGTWTRRQATFFPLLERVSRVGDASPYLSAEWTQARHLVQELTRKGLLR